MGTVTAVYSESMALFYLVGTLMGVALVNVDATARCEVVVYSGFVKSHPVGSGVRSIPTVALFAQQIGHSG